MHIWTCLSYGVGSNLKTMLLDATRVCLLLATNLMGVSGWMDWTWIFCSKDLISRPLNGERET